MFLKGVTQIQQSKRTFELKILAKENIPQTVYSSYYDAYTILLTQYPVVVEDFAHLHANVLDDQVDVEFVNLEVIFAVLVG